MIVIAAFSLLLSQSPEARYQDCVSLAETDAEAARAYAEEWAASGGGALAGHCAATAALALGSPASAGAMLVDLASQSEDETAQAGLYLQAAEAFAAGGRLAATADVLHLVTPLIEGDASLAGRAAGIAASVENWSLVIAFLDQVEAEGALSSFAYALRGRARFVREEYDLAAADAAEALALDPLEVQALVLRGDLRLQGVALPEVETGPADPTGQIPLK